MGVNTEVALTDLELAELLAFREKFGGWPAGGCAWAAPAPETHRRNRAAATTPLTVVRMRSSWWAAIEPALLADGAAVPSIARSRRVVTP